MPSILLSWELGSGLGHLAPLRAVGSELVRRGHRVAIAANNVPLCRQGFAGTGVEVYPAPLVPLSDRRLKIPCTYSDILHDCGYSSAAGLTTAATEWLKLFDSFQPHLVLCDHSPTALLASRARDFATAAVGVGFVCPPDASPLPSLHHVITEPHWATEVEQTVLDNMNVAVKAIGGKQVSRVTQIFGDAKRQYLLTCQELDHYAAWRTSGDGGPSYWQPPVMLPAPRCDWPKGAAVSNGSPRVFVYLREDPSLQPLLRGLALKRIATVCCAPHMPKLEQDAFNGTSVRVTTSPIDLMPLVRDCDAAVLNGGHGTVYAFLRAGVPMLLVPLMLEQQVTAHRLVSLGVARQVPPGDLNALATALEELLENPRYKQSAQAVSQRIPSEDEGAAVARLVDDLKRLTPA